MGCKMFYKISTILWHFWKDFGSHIQDFWQSYMVDFFSISSVEPLLSHSKKVASINSTAAI